MPEQHLTHEGAPGPRERVLTELSVVIPGTGPAGIIEKRKGSIWSSLRNLCLCLCTDRSIPYLFLCVALPAVLLLCFLVPPMQSVDESRHFVRAVQIAQGGWLPEIDAKTGRVGGIIPTAVAEFVRHWMNTEFLRSEDALHTIRERMSALEHDSQAQAPIYREKFVEFPSAGIYPPALYLPQSAGISTARFFSTKIYVWFYSARVWNAISSVLLIFLALRIAPQHQMLLLLPAVLPMSLSQIASISSDASIIGLSVLFVALCIRFLGQDSALIRLGLVLCLFLLVLGKPVHLALGLLLLSAHKRLGWRRASSFCSTAMGIAATSYAIWSSLVRRCIALAGESHGQNPSAQIRFIIAYPNLLMRVLLATLKHDTAFLCKEVIGLFGWEELPLPIWVYLLITCFGAAVCLVILRNRTKVTLSSAILGSIAALGVALGVLLAAYVLWTPPGSSTIIRLQGRYFLPIIPILALIAPPFSRLSRPSRIVLGVSSIGCLMVSTYFTVRTLNHYYFPESALVGKNLSNLFTEVPNQPCPASIHGGEVGSWLDWVITGTTPVSGNFRVLATTGDGRIIGESDPALTGADFPYVLLPGSSRSRWRMHVWYINKDALLRLWLVRNNSACGFGPELHFTPIQMPDA